MRIGVVFPQTESGADPGALRAFAQTAEELGYTHLVVYDHVLGADTAHYRNWTGPYTSKDIFHEPFVLFGYLAAVTKRLELVTAIVILPQRQTALVAKQAAEVDVLSGGRLRLGVGLGWNAVEYEALGEEFHNRGKRIEEQVQVLRMLWTQEVVTFQGQWHRITGAGINPLPVQRPIPLWFGGSPIEPVLRRIARLGDGWFPQQRPDAKAREALERLRLYAREAGRDPKSIGVEARVRLPDGLETALTELKGWEALGATGVALSTMRAGLRTMDQHIRAIREFKEALGK